MCEQRKEKEINIDSFIFCSNMIGKTMKNKSTEINSEDLQEID